MALPRTLARLNKIGLNRVTTRLAPVVPGFGVIVHQGRRSAPVPDAGQRVRVRTGYVIALTYGPDSDWVRTSWPPGAASCAPAAGRWP